METLSPTHSATLSPTHLIALLLFTSFCILALFIWEAHIGIDLSDESFLWYGAIAVNHGQVPIRDFYAYDPGRYYLTALVMKLLGNNGIIASRIAEAIVQGLGLFLALYLIIRQLKFTKSHVFYLFLTTLTLLIWMVPLYKVFDMTAAIVLIVLLVFLIEKNTLSSVFWTGVGVGLIAIIGRNHGVYGTVASVSLIIYLSWTMQRYSIVSSLKWWLMGVVVGYTPLIIMLLFVPGFSQAFFKGIYFLFATQSTNLYLPIPWPWQATTLSNFVLGIFFIAILMFAICSFARVVLSRSSHNHASVLTACAFLALPYAHYAFSRADNVHLALGIFPFLIGMLAYFYRIHNKFNLLMLFLMFMLSGIIVLPLHPGAQSFRDKSWRYLTITGTELKVNLDTQIKMAMFKRLIDQYAEKGRAFLVMPFNFGMYPIFARESPTWDLYPLFSRSVEEQAADIVRIKKADPGFVVIYDYPLDNNEKRQFHYTHALIFKYIAENYALIHDEAESAHIYIYRKQIKNSIQSTNISPNNPHQKKYASSIIKLTNQG